jgi:hypothetical protein
MDAVNIHIEEVLLGSASTEDAVSEAIGASVAAALDAELAAGVSTAVARALPAASSVLEGYVS